jgi:serine/threonine-protein kinase
VATFEAGRIVGGRYRLEALIGQGGMGSVWRARHLQIDRLAAIKFIHVAGPTAAKQAERFLREARAAASVRHRMVVDIVDFGSDEDGQPYMVMELLEGQSLASRLTNGAPLSLGELIKIVEQALIGLGAVHAAGLVHRDLKPENVFLVRDEDGWFPKLLDFGISRATEGSGSRGRGQSTLGAIAGTPHYMAPEQARAVRDVDARVDIYAMGAILYEAITGALPFDSENVGDLLIQIATTSAVPIESLRPEIGPELAAVVRKAMASDREQRFASAKEMRAALLEAAKALPEIDVMSTPTRAPRSHDSLQATADVPYSSLEIAALSGPASTPQFVTRPPPRRRALVFAAAAGAAAIVGGLIWWAASGPETPAPVAATQPVPAVAPAAPVATPAPVLPSATTGGVAVTPPVHDAPAVEDPANAEAASAPDRAPRERRVRPRAREGTPAGGATRRVIREADF